MGGRRFGMRTRTSGAFYELSYRGFTTYRVARNVRDHPRDGALRLEIPRYDAVRGLVRGDSAQIESPFHHE